MPSRSAQTELSCAKAKAKWGEKIYVRSANGETTFAEIEDDGGLWRPVFDSARNWAGYRYSNSPNYASRRRRKP
jgi:hypothetical protein